MHGKHISYKTQKPIYRLMRVEVENQQFAFVIKKKQQLVWRLFHNLKVGIFKVHLQVMNRLQEYHIILKAFFNDHNSTHRWFFVFSRTKLTTSWLTPQFFKTSFLNFGQFVSSFFTYHSTSSASVIVTHPLTSRVLRTGNILARSRKWLSVISGWSSKSANPK